MRKRKKLYTVKTLAMFFQVTEISIMALVKRGKLQGHRDEARGRWLFEHDDILRYVDKRINYHAGQRDRYAMRKKVLKGQIHKSVYRASDRHSVLLRFIPERMSREKLAELKAPTFKEVAAMWHKAKEEDLVV